jgi:hypothetical protein
VVHDKTRGASKNSIENRPDQSEDEQGYEATHLIILPIQNYASAGGACSSSIIVVMALGVTALAASSERNSLVDSL